MHWSNILLFLVAGVQLALALVVILKNPRNRINQTFGAGIFCMGIWVFLIALFRIVSVEEIVRILYFFQLSIGMMVMVFLQWFTYYFPYIRKKEVIFLQIIYLLPAIVAILIVLFYSKAVVTIEMNPAGNIQHINKLYHVLYSSAFLLNMLVAYHRLLKKYFELSAGFLKKALGYVIISLIPPSIFSLTFNVYFLFIDSLLKYEWIGATGTITFCLVIFYFIFLSDKKISIR